MRGKNSSRTLYECIMEKEETATVQYHQGDYKTPKKSSMIIDGERLLDKINILTTKPENQSCTKLPTIKDFVIIKPISRGAFGKVFLGYKNNDPNKLYAIKVMRKSEMINKNMVSQVITERNALALSRSPFCVSLFYSLQSVSYVYLVMDYMVGGDLKSLLTMFGYFDEAVARFYVAEVALALQYLHEHGIVHRDIKPDNMLLSATGHVKLTDFGLSKIDNRRDLEISDLINISPTLNARTPGQLLSLTSHLSFGSEKKIECGTGTSNLMNAMNKRNVKTESSDSEADTSLNEAERTSDSKISGVSPFFSVEEINVSITHTCTTNTQLTDSTSSYHTCTSTEISKNEVSTTSNPVTNTRHVAFVDISIEIKAAAAEARANCNGCKQEEYTRLKDCIKENKISIKLERNEPEEASFEFSMVRKRSMDERLRMSKGPEDSGVSSRKSDNSTSQINTTTSSLDKAENMCISKNDTSCSDYSRSYTPNITSETSSMRSPFRNLSKNFKRPEFLRGMKRKLNLLNRSENSSNPEADSSKSGYNSNSGSTGLTQEIDILDIGSSTPKKRKAANGVLKVRSLSDDEMPQALNEHVTNVVFSTPVSSQKVPRRDGGLMGKLKATRFALPSSMDTKKSEQAAEKASGVQYLKMAADDPTMSPINLGNNIPKTPIRINTPFRTPKSVRRGGVGRQSSERILGTPDYLAPELLLRQGHGPAVDWWALGVCFYEFLTGVPPFNDETPHKVFDNILNKNIEWPQGDEALSAEAVEAVDLLLTIDPTERPAAKDVQRMRFFESINWKNIENEEPPFVPTPENPTDTAYFEARNNLQHLKLSNFTLED
ncbi:serine/threonine-protein kinase greatwall isoform X1 [Rhagoletis pomonella]|uniref:serine/threonine-protein kinase greatwall isoform X1 n=1 Tax=Rhagoletis pomonella TaxID=28610 RepID=UPI0017829ACE|nr:serine/threonine-protein kinase greatwall isoform X1 [Rhagoletis pomonella]